MKNSKLVRVLKTFSKAEFGEFRKFTASPYFSRGRNLTDLLSALKRYYPEFNSNKFTQENISKKIGKKGKKASPALLKLQMSELCKLAEEYISLEGWKTQQGLNTYFFANRCKKKGLNQLAESRIIKEISGMGADGIDWRYYLNYHFSKVELINLSFLKDKPLAAFENVSELSEIVLHQFLSFAARYIFNLVFFRIAYNQNIDNNLLLGFFGKLDYDALLKGLEQKKDVYSAASRVYLLFIMMQINYNVEEYYFRFKKYLFENIEIFSVYEKSFFLQTVLAKTEHSMAGKEYQKYAREAFEIINFRLENNLHKQYPDAPYTAVEYFAALNIGFILKEIKWMKDFIAKYQDEVPEEHRQALAQLNDAFLKFAAKDHKGALSVINQTSGLPFLLNYELKRLQLMAYYELNMTDEIFNGLNAFRGYLKTNKNVSRHFMESNLNFMKYYLHLARFKLNEVPMEEEVVHREIENSDTENKGWLLEKIEELQSP